MLGVTVTEKRLSPKIVTWEDECRSWEAVIESAGLFSQRKPNLG